MLRRFALSLILAVPIAPLANAAIHLIRDYKLRAPRNRHAVFAMALTPQQELLSFVANSDGKWRLSRIRGWLEKEPREDIATVPGLIYGEREQWSGPWSPDLLVTPDGRFVVCIASGRRSQGRGQDDVVSVVDLAAFQVVANIQTPSIPVLAGDYRRHQLDKRGHLVIRAYTLLPGGPADDLTVRTRVRMALLSLPTLAVTSQCEYLESRRTGVPTLREDEGSCRAFLDHESGSISLSGFVDELKDSHEESRTDQSRRPPQCAFLGYARYAAPDNRFEREICQTAHRGFWGNSVVTKVVENIFDARTGGPAGSVDEPVSSIESRFALVGDRDYLLVVEGGTHLMVYAIAN